MNDRLNIRLGALRAAVEAEARREGLTPAAWVRRVVVEALERLGAIGGKDRCPNFDPHYGECRMADGSNPRCHPNAKNYPPLNQRDA